MLLMSVVNRDSRLVRLSVLDRFTHCTVEGLSPSHDYQFRVIAENFYGRSDPCEPTSLIQTVTEQEGRRKKGLGDADGQSTVPVGRYERAVCGRDSPADTYSVY